MHTQSGATDADDDPPPASTPIRLTLLPGHEWDAELQVDGMVFSYRDTLIGRAYANAQRWAPGPTRPFLSDHADAVLDALKKALAAFDALVCSLVAAGCTENEIRFLLDGHYLEDLALRIVFGITRAAHNDEAAAGG
jgi:hypothetical protein